MRYSESYIRCMESGAFGSGASDEERRDMAERGKRAAVIARRSAATERKLRRFARDSVFAKLLK